MNCQTTEPGIRYEVINTMKLCSKNKEIKALFMPEWIRVTSSKYFHYNRRHRKDNDLHVAGIRDY